VSHGFQSLNHSSLLISLLLLLAGDIEVNPGPTSPQFLNTSHLNIRSATTITADLDKPAALQEFVTDNNLDILTLSESWLSIDTPPSILNSLTPPGFSIIHSPRITGLGGGLALIYRSSIKMSKILLPNCSSFESLCIRCTTTAKPSLSFILLMIYRPPSSSKSDFISDFSFVLEDLATSPSELIITGDFNVHVDQPNCSFASSFLNLLDVFSLTQHVTFPTHSSGHTLDLIITRSCSTTISSINFTDPNISDHYAVLFSVSVTSTCKSKTQYITNLLALFAQST